MNVNKYLFELIRKGQYWQYTNVNGIGKRPKFYFTVVQLFIILLSVLISIFFLPKGIKDIYVGYIIASLSIFVGLFLSLILTIFDKFQKTDFKLAKVSQDESSRLIRIKNFFHQFTSLTSYSILISLFSILLLCVFIIIENSTKTVDINVIKQSFNDSCLLIKVIILLLHRIITLYFLLDFVNIAIYAITSIHNFIITEYDKVKIKEE